MMTPNFQRENGVEDKVIDFLSAMTAAVLFGCGIAWLFEQNNTSLVLSGWFDLDLQCVRAAVRTLCIAIYCLTALHALVRREQQLQRA